MLDLFALQLTLVALAAALTVVALAGQQPQWRKFAALGLFIGVVATGYVYAADLLGRPKPSRLAAIVSKEKPAIVVASLLVENRAIYLWLKRDGSVSPMAFELPWNMKTAKGLRKAQNQAEARGTKTRMRLKKAKNKAEGEWVFHAAPVDKLPPKPKRG